MIRLFVYGTLMHDGCRSGVLSGQRWLGVRRTLPIYQLLDLGPYPGLVPGLPGRSIEGELYEVDTGLIAQLDQIEGAPTLFRLAAVQLQDETEPVWTYFYQRVGPQTPTFPGDRWDNHRASDDED